MAAVANVANRADDNEGGFWDSVRPLDLQGDETAPTAMSAPAVDERHALSEEDRREYGDEDAQLATGATCAAWPSFRARK